MPTVLSHIVQKRYSQEYENIATDALAFILESSEPAREFMLQLLRSLAKDVPPLRFQTQQTAENVRPDMTGHGDNDSRPRVFVEAKFWAGLTENQPASYLEQLSKCAQPAILLMIVPEARIETMWRELSRRLEERLTPIPGKPSGYDVVARSAMTPLGPILALTTWTRLLSAMMRKVEGIPATQNDLQQLQALCETADADVFVPISAEEISDQRIPRLLLNLSAAWQSAVDMAATEGVLCLDGVKPQASPERAGRYARFWNAQGVGVWIGVHLKLWSKFGGTPLWLVFTRGKFGRMTEVQRLLAPWAAREGVFCAVEKNEYVVAIDLPPGEEKDYVANSILERLRMIGDALKAPNVHY